MVRITLLVSSLVCFQLLIAQVTLALCSVGTWRLLFVDGFHSNLSTPSYLGYKRKCTLSFFRQDIPIDGDVFESESKEYKVRSRRDFLFYVRLLSSGAASSIGFLRPSMAAEASSVDEIRNEIQRARKQMNVIPDLIRSEQWDSVRAVLITPPLSDLWTKSSRKVPLLVEYATAIGETPSGDELAVLEAKEDVSGHLRFLDMAVYNNNFNPIKSMGETGATKELIRSYYDDPTNEYKASIAALDELIQLGNVQ